MDEKSKITLNVIALIALLFVLFISHLIPYTLIDRLGSFYIFYLIAVPTLLVIISLILLYIIRKNKLPYGLIGFNIGTTIYLILVGIISALELSSIGCNGPGMCGLLTGVASFFLLFIITIGWAIGYSYGKKKSKKQCATTH